ncbi:MAG: carboxypeptidase-like regulatory domain-containing protein, partial [Prevotella sp.]|nr:carboxypeptidase-like regulatory domain-containing protein [Prevotella sp.]
MSGIVTDGVSPLEDVIIKASSENHTLAYTMTDGAGKYRIQFPLTDKPIRLSAELLGYEKQTKSIENRTQTCNFILHEKTQVLKEVIVKASPITQRGDTLSYNVASFATASDYTLKDVLKKLPGIEVA